MTKNKDIFTTRRGKSRIEQGPGRGLTGLPSLLPIVMSNSQSQVELTLADEARHTSQHDHSTWAQGSQLRKMPISFISVGANNPLSQDMMPSVEKPAKSLSTTERTVIPKCKPEGCPTYPKHPDRKFPEVTGGSLSYSDSSSDEIIVFKGRNAIKQTSRRGFNLSAIRTELSSMEMNMQITPQQAEDHSGSKSNRHHRRGRIPKSSTDEDATIADYIANMREHGEINDIVLTGEHKGQDQSNTEASANSKVRSNVGSAAHTVMVPAEAMNTLDITEPEQGTTGPTSVEVSRSTSHLHQRHDESRTQVRVECETTNPPGNILGGDKFASESDSSTNAVDDGSPIGFDPQTDFDLMDWERQSLRSTKGKRRRGILPPEGLDAETEQILQAAWTNDRQKKSQRKKTREEQRALGLLGKKSRPNDLRVRYPLGMGLQQVAEEIKIFLCDGEQNISLPPMDKHARKMVHEIAIKFSIKSKSIGSGDQRRPILFRTKGTLPYLESSFDQVIQRVDRKFFPRNSTKVKHPNRTTTSYKDGEIVGAMAPELGTDNRGRAMLERMGWSLGTALGPQDNQGILHPVSQAMKRTKAGLG